VKILPVLIALAVLAPWTLPAGAQASRPTANAGLARAERNAIELKQGMSAEDVEKLLGKPRRTALKSNGSSPGTLQWTYAWADSSQSSLRVEFAATKTPAEWSVTSWDWANY